MGTYICNWHGFVIWNVNGARRRTNCVYFCGRGLRWTRPVSYTHLHDYYVGIGKFKDASSGYEPKLGDVAIYRNSPVFGDHTNIVLKNEGGVLTTIGGNEDGRQRIFVNQQKNYAGLLGYGVLE